MIFYDKRLILRRYSSELGEYNRPVNTLNDVGSYPCTVQQSTNSTNQLQPQKENYTGWTLYVSEDVVIKLGDICYIYDLDEYDNIILASELIMIADKPYRKRDHLEVPLNYDEEV